MNNQAQRYVIYVDDCEIRNNAFNGLSLKKLSLLCLDMKSALKGIWFAKKKTLPEAVIIHYPTNLKWLKHEKQMIEIFIDWQIPVLLVFHQEEDKEFKIIEKIGGAEYVSYADPDFMIMEIYKIIKCIDK